MIENTEDKLGWLEFGKIDYVSVHYESTLKKIKKLRNFLDSEGYSNIEIEVDGKVSFENALRMSREGADIFVAGTSSVFSAEGSMSENISKLREIICIG